MHRQFVTVIGNVGPYQRLVNQSVHPSGNRKHTKVIVHRLNSKCWYESSRHPEGQAAQFVRVGIEPTSDIVSYPAFAVHFRLVRRRIVDAPILPPPSHSGKWGLRYNDGMTPGSAWHLLVTLPCLSGIPSRERAGEAASNSEKRRWLQNRSVVINGTKPLPDELVSHPLTELILFPKGNRVTLV